MLFLISHDGRRGDGQLVTSIDIRASGVHNASIGCNPASNSSISVKRKACASTKHTDSQPKEGQQPDPLLASFHALLRNFPQKLIAGD
jgi:hypothetical protein